MRSNSFIIVGLLSEELRKLELTYSLLFASGMGKLSVAVNYWKFQKRDRVVMSSYRESGRGAVITIRIGH